MTSESENPYQSPLVAGAEIERAGPSGWRFLPMTLAISLGVCYLLFWGLGIIGALVSPSYQKNGFAWQVSALTVFLGLPGIGMLISAWLWFRVRYAWATVLCGICILPLLLMVALLMLVLVV